MNIIRFSILLLFLLSAGLTGQIARADLPANASLYYTQDELTILKELKTAPTHSVMWNNISSWVAAHLGDTPPAQPGDGSGTKIASEEIKQFLDKMIFMYHMTDDTRYADAAVAWMVYVADNWNGWYPARDYDPQYFRSLAPGLANGYYSLRDYMSETDRVKVLSNLETYAYPCYEHYEPDGSAIYLPSKNAAVTEVLGMVGLAMGADSGRSEDYLDLGLLCADKAVEYGGGNDGGWFEGPNYGLESNGFTRLFVFYDALRRIKGIDRFATYSGFLSGVPYYFLYITNPDDHTGKATHFQVEDGNGDVGYFEDYDSALSFLYKAAREYNDGYAQMAGDTYDLHTTILSFIWKDPDVAPLDISDLPWYRSFQGNDVNYVFMKSGWGADDLNILFKSGGSYNHAHPNQNTFMITKYGRPFTSGTGYATSWTEYKVTEFNNCLTVGEIYGTDGKLYGYGQAKEPGDIGGAVVPLGTRGKIVDSNFNDIYYYVAGDASALYTGRVYNEPNTWPMHSSGDLDKWVRHFVFFPAEEYIVVYDDVVSPTPQQVNWWYTAVDLYDEDRSSAPPELKIDGNIITQVLPGGRGLNLKRTFEIKVLEPSSFDYELETNDGAYNEEFSYILVWPSTDVAAPKFLTVMTPDDRLSTSGLVTTEVQQGNCMGVIVDSTGGRDLILFSTDGKPVNQYIELGGYYQSADGNPYTFSGTQVLADFATYQVMRLEAGTGGNRPPVLDSIGNKTVSEGKSLTFTISATDPDGGTLTYSASNLLPGASFDPATRTFSWTPVEGQAGTYPDVHFEVLDGVLTVFENITITVTANNAPVLESIGNKTVDEGQQLQFVVTAADSDNDTLTYSAYGLPSGASFDSGTRTFSWTPDSDQVGSYTNIRFEITDGALTVSEKITITVNASTPPPSGDTGGGGGGGGGGSSSGGGGGGGVAGITSLRASMSSAGLMFEEVSATDINLKVELRIPQGTTVMNKFSQPPTSIRIKPLGENHAASSGSEIIIQSFEIEPTGTTFDTSATLIFKYTHSEIPQDITENSLYIALWDPAALAWIDLGGTVDPNARTVSVPIKSLSTYALMVHNRPASFEVATFTVASNEVGLGEDVTVNINVENKGDQTGTCKVCVTLDGVTVQSKTIDLAGGDSQTVTFTITPDTVGEHKAGIGGMLPKVNDITIIVSPPASKMLWYRAWWLWLAAGLVIAAVATIIVLLRRFR